MARTHSGLSLGILRDLDDQRPKSLQHIYEVHHGYENKTVYDALYRLEAQGLVAVTRQGYILTLEGDNFINRALPKKDGIWKIVIFDIPEKQRPARSFLRERLKSLGFKKWQDSTWISPFQLDGELEKELEHLAKRYFIRLIKTKDINFTKDLEKMFPD